MAGDISTLVIEAQGKFKDTLEQFIRYLGKVQDAQKALEKGRSGLSSMYKDVDAATKSLKKYADALDRAAEKTSKLEKATASAKSAGVLGGGAAAVSSGGGGRSSFSGIASMGMLGGAMRAVGLAASGYAVKQIAEFSAESAVMGAQAAAIEDSLDSLSRAYNINGQGIVSDMKKMSHGAVVESELMISVNRALMAQNSEVANAMPKVFEIARSASLAAGKDFQYVYDSLITGILRGSYRLIDNADIYLSIGESVEAYAASLGKTSEQLSLQQRQVAILNAVVEQGSVIVDTVNMKEATQAEKLKAVAVAATEARIELGKYFATMATQSGAAEGAAGFFSRMGQEFESGTDMLKIVSEIDAKIKASGKSQTFGQKVGAAWDDWAKSWNAGAPKGDAFAKAIAAAVIEASRYKTKLDEIARWIDDDPTAAWGRWVSGAREAEEAVISMNFALQQSRGLIEGINAIFPGGGPSTGIGVVSTGLLSAYGPLSDKQRKDAAAAYPAQLHGQLFTGDVPPDRAAAMFRTMLPEGLEAIKSSRTQLDLWNALALGQKKGSDFADGFKKSTKDNSSKIQSAINEWFSQIEGAATAGLDVTETDLLATKLGVYKDKPMENTRRLKDIVEGGLEVVKRHPEYQGQLGIPGEVMGNNDQLRLWAMQEYEKSVTFQRPQDIDPAKFIESFKAQRAAEATKQSTLAGLGALLAKEGIKPTLKEKAFIAGAAGFDNTEEQAAAFADTMAKGFAGTDVSQITLVSWTEMFTRDLKQYEQMGTTLGSAIAGATVKALVDNMKTVRSQVAGIIAPDVASILLSDPAFGGGRGGGEKP